MRGIEIPAFFDFVDGRMKVFCMPLIRRSDVVMQDFRPCLVIINLDKAKVLKISDVFEDDILGEMSVWNIIIL